MTIIDHGEYLNKNILQNTGFDMRSLQDSGKKFPLAAGNTHMSCSRGFFGTVVLGNVLGMLTMSTKSEAKGA